MNHLTLKNKSNPLISILVNCFNGEKFLDQALNSIIRQTYENLEVIFWDNQSTDNSAKIFSKYLKDKRFKYYLSSRHTTQYTARSEAMGKARGELVAFLDVDDYWDSDKLSKQVQLFDDKKIGLVYSNFYWKDELNGKEYAAYKVDLPSGYIVKNLLLKYRVGLLTIMIRRSAYNSLSKGFDSQYNVIGDFDLIMRMSLDYKFSYVAEPLAFCRWHGGNMQITHKNEYFSELKNWILIMSKDINFKTLKEFDIFIDNIKTSEAIFRVDKKEYFKSFKQIREIQSRRNKLKLLLALVIPKKILNIIRLIQ
jgi:glycosyltransferase involved in cell wall biosynthesis